MVTHEMAQLRLRFAYKLLSVWVALLFVMAARADTYSSLTIPQGGSVSIPSPAGNLVLVMQGDGNLVLYENGVPLWDSGTAGQNCSTNQCYAAFQSDGNFVVYNGPTPLWASNTGGNSGAQLLLSDQSPQIEIVGTNQAVLWSIPKVVGTLTGSNTGSRGMNTFTLADGPHVVYVDGNQHVHQMWYTLSIATWQDEDLTIALAAPLAGPGSQLSTFIVGADPHVFYVDSNQHVEQMWYSVGLNHWYSEDLTASQGATSAAAGTGLSTFTGPDGSHIFFIDVNGHMDQIWWTGSQWLVQDLTSQVSGAPPSTASAITNFSMDSTVPQMVFTDINGHIWQEWWQVNHMVEQDLTATVNGPPAVSGSALASWMQGDGPHIVCQIGNQHILQLWYATATGTWNYLDLTGVTGAALPEPGTPLNTFVGPDGDHVYFIDTNQHLDQLWWTGIEWVWQDLSSGVAGPNLPNSASGLATLSIDGIVPQNMFLDSVGDLEQRWWQGGGLVQQDLTATVALICGAMQPEYLGTISDDSPTFLQVQATGLSPAVSSVQFLVYNEADEISDAQVFPGSAPSNGSSSAAIGTNNLTYNGGYTVVAKLSGGGSSAYCSDKAFFTITSDLPPAQPQGACNGLAGIWTDDGSDGSSAQWTLSQSATSVSGTVVASLGSCGNATWQASGSYQGNGTFSLQATNPQAPQGCGAEPNVSETITISGPGCNSGSGTSSNSDGYNGTNSWSSTASLPTGESSSFKGWDDHGYTTEARFGATVSATNGQEFGGRLIREQGSVNDGCWDDSSAIPQHIQVDGQSNTASGTWAIQPDNSYGDDMIGYDPGTVLYYQQHRAKIGLPMPCTMTSQQQMQIQTGSGTWQTYQINPITVTINSSSIAVQRNSASSGTQPYPLQ